MTTPDLVIPTDLPERIYRGHRDQTGTTITVENADGESLGPLTHPVRHSPTLQWGNLVSEARACARSLLLDALGPAAAACPTCRGHGKIHLLDDDLTVVPYMPQPGVPVPDSVIRCFACRGTTYRDVPYFEFAWEHVACWGDEWTIRRSDILNWLTRAARNKTGH